MEGWRQKTVYERVRAPLWMLAGVMLAVATAVAYAAFNTAGAIFSVTGPGIVLGLFGVAVYIRYKFLSKYLGRP